MTQTGVKTLTVPEAIYEDMKKVLDQASVKHDIRALFDRSGNSIAEQKSLLKHILSDITTYDDLAPIKLHGLILTLLFLKYDFTKSEAFNILEDIFSQIE
jgi:hypothetical protein